MSALACMFGGFCHKNISTELRLCCIRVARILTKRRTVEKGEDNFVTCSQKKKMHTPLKEVQIF